MKAHVLSEELNKQLAALPTTAGVYIFRDEQKNIIYIGKAVNLRSRVRSYWASGAINERPKLAVMMPKVESVESILTNSEKEALLLEANLVRQHLPRYNVALKDDKRYPWLAITYDESFPRLIMVRDPQRYKKSSPNARVFGPYVQAGAMWDTLRTLRKVFPMRQRPKPLFKDRPCMNYHLGLCLAPCQKLVGESEYLEMVQQVEMFLAGRQHEVVLQLKNDMNAASSALEYEKAAKIRNRLYALNSVLERQQVFFSSRKVNQDVIGEWHNERIISICLLRIREGKLIASDVFNLPLVDKTSVQEGFQSFVDQYYTAAESITLPSEIILQHDLDDKAALLDLLEQQRGKKVKILHPERGAKIALLSMAQKNAHNALEMQAQRDTLDKERIDSTLEQLKSELGLRKLPKRIECFDISNTQGTDNVASMVVFENAAPKKNDYRRFKIRSVEGQANDFASMQEVVYRRYKRLLEETKELPDLIVIDGGKGQLSAAFAVLTDLGMIKQDIIGLAKKQEEVYLPNSSKPIWLPRNAQALYLLQHIRDEAHRFAITFHRKLRAKRSLMSNFDDLPGVGAARRKLLIKHFGSFDKLMSTSAQELQSVPRLPKAVAAAIFETLHKDIDKT